MVASQRHWVLRYSGQGRAPAADVATIEATVTVLDRTASMLLIEATGGEVGDLMAVLPDWSAARERTFSLAS